nr:uncharacterized protein CI109_007546 [Kwoniella shandongensis]KAA5524169.1 hypothetical protein CI109_007546 [Kwoniella shandongensis]
MLGGTEYVIKDKESVRTYRLPTIPNLSSTGSMRMKVFAAAPPSAAAPPARAHPTPPSLMLSRDEPRSDPMGPLSPSSPSPSPPPGAATQAPSPPPLPNPAREPTRPPQARPPTRHTATQPEQGLTSFGTPTPRPRLQTRATPQSTPRQVSRVHQPPIPSQRLDAETPQHTMTDLLPLPGSIKHLHPNLVLKDAINELQALLGEKYSVLAYLDDIFILGEDDGALQIATEYFGREDSPLRLNRTKCKQVTIEDVRTSAGGFRLLGSCVGSLEARRTFLQGEIDEVRESLQHLNQLPKQHALLILRFSCQQKLRHLQPTLYSTDLGDLWDQLDEMLWVSLDGIRGFGPDASRPALDRQLLSLPPTFGGLGLASHHEYAPLAYKASTSTAITSLLVLVEGLDEPVDPLSQQELCKEANNIKYKKIMASLPLPDRISMVESSSQLGRKWLSAVPSAPRFIIPDAAIQSALLYRTLQSGYRGSCRKCTSTNTLGHDENCAGRSRHTKARHDAVKHRLASALKSIPGASVVEEPYMIDRLDRLNDIRITMDDADNRQVISEEYDLKIVSLFATTYQEALWLNGKTREEKMEYERLEREGLWEEDTTRRVMKVLAQQARRKVTSLPAEERQRVEGTGLFTPLVLSTGGLQDEETAIKINEWKKWNLPGAAYSWMLMSISVALVRARARTFLARAVV